MLGGRERLTVQQGELPQRREWGVDNRHSIKYQHPEEQTNLIGHQPSDTIRSLHTFLNGAEEFDLNQQLTELKTENLEAHRKVLRQNFKKQVTSRSTAHHT